MAHIVVWLPSSQVKCLLYSTGPSSHAAIWSWTTHTRSSHVAMWSLGQGDSLSPLLFCLCLAPLSHVLRTLEGYRSEAFGGTINPWFWNSFCTVLNYVQDQVFRLVIEQLEEMFIKVTFCLACYIQDANQQLCAWLYITQLCSSRRIGHPM